MSATPKEKTQASAKVESPTHTTNQSKKLFDDRSPAQPAATRKRKREGRYSEEKSQKMRFLVESTAFKSNESEDSFKSSHRSLNNQTENNGDEDVAESTPSRGISNSKSCESIESQAHMTPLKPLKLKIKNGAKDTKKIKMFGAAESPVPEFVYPRELFEPSDNEKEVSPERLFDNRADNAYNGLTAGSPLFVPQFSPRLWSRCDTAMARRAYNELDDITVRLGEVMRGIRVLIGNDDSDGLDDSCSCSSTEIPYGIHDPFEEFDESTRLELVDEDHPIAVSADEDEIADGSGKFHEDE
ncbi:hypothetical protein N7457_003136 [Penicillium paradoxum]|uniref:uncharacterized protein n=1 Tax=Penicillium paradoxum TaxID=176176 RepID=UPI002548F811|nr:uncharacterized protein N7457_003136 [Penicillium paradoxum]KAJ5788146.1 hypothetical protein N7457_003136 [Penicillium paradoxum]